MLLFQEGSFIPEWFIMIHVVVVVWQELGEEPCFDFTFEVIVKRLTNRWWTCLFCALVSWLLLNLTSKEERSVRAEQPIRTITFYDIHYYPSVSVTWSSYSMYNITIDEIHQFFVHQFFVYCFIHFLLFFIVRFIILCLYMQLSIENMFSLDQELGNLSANLPMPNDRSNLWISRMGAICRLHSSTVCASHPLPSNLWCADLVVITGNRVLSRLELSWELLLMTKAGVLEESNKLL